MVRDALKERFDEVCREELGRLQKKLTGLSDDERESVEAAVADVIGALARVPGEALTGSAPAADTLHAVVQLFDLRTQPSLH
jgi:glutamyl-tRNA reductase